MRLSLFKPGHNLYILKVIDQEGLEALINHEIITDVSGTYSINDEPDVYIDTKRTDTAHFLIAQGICIMDDVYDYPTEVKPPVLTPKQVDEHITLCMAIKGNKLTGDVLWENAEVNYKEIMIIYPCNHSQYGQCTSITFKNGLVKYVSQSISSIQYLITQQGE